MSKIWIIAPNDNNKFFDEVWNYNKVQNNISIGWDKLPIDYHTLSKDTQTKLAKEKYPKRRESNIRNMFDFFYNQIEIDDIIIARKGIKIIVGVGTVIKKAYHDAGSILSKEYGHRDILEVNWLPFESINLEEQLLQMTIVPITMVELPKELHVFFENVISEQSNASIYFSDSLAKDTENIGNEGKIKERFQTYVERDSKFAKAYKYKYIIVNKEIQCKGCGDVNYIDKYNIEPIKFLELHHLKPLSMRKSMENAETFEKDVVLLCPNCHTAIHRLLLKNNLQEMSLEEFRKQIEVDY